MDCSKTTWSRKQQPTPLFLPGKFHGQRSLVGYSHDWACTHTHTSGTPESKAPLAFKVRCSWGYLPGTGHPGWKVWCVAQMPHSFGRISSILIILSFVSHQPLSMGLTVSWLCLFLPVLLWFLLLWKILCFCLSPVFSPDGCSVNIDSCNSSVLLRGDELKFP